MNILSIDTTRSSYSLSVSKNNNISTYKDQSDIASSETILSEINNLVLRNNIKPSDINSVIYNNGPGSFTGVRVSSSIVQAIGFSNNCPVYGINSLMLDAYSLYSEKKIEKIQVVRKAFGDQFFHGLLTLSDKECLLDSKISTSTLDSIEFYSKYTLLTDLKDGIKNKHLIVENYIGSELLIEYYKKYSEKKSSFDYKDALPSYAGHTI